MTATIHKNHYSFDEFLEKRNGKNDYTDNPFLQHALKTYAGVNAAAIHEKLLEFSPKSSFRWRHLADAAGRVEARPYLVHYDAHNHRIDRVVRSKEVAALEKEIFSEGLLSEKTLDWERAGKRYLLSHNGETSILCPMVCTEGLIALIEHFPEQQTPELKKILNHCKEGIDGNFALGAQFMTEIQGGSDIPANKVEAVPQADGTYRLYGNKFFCSVAHCDYAVVTARMADTGKVTTFIVPSWLSGDKKRERRNGFTINRLKNKLGTTELPTAEFEYDGAVAYPIGAKEGGVAVAVSIVLTLSRLDIGMTSGAFMMRAAREARMYAGFREAFGQKINEFSLVAGQLQEMEEAAKRTTAGAFAIYQQYLDLGKNLIPQSFSKKHFDFRELVLLQKVATTKETVDVLRTAISVFGGNGAIEDFSSLPRIFRDAMVNELWEGPKNVLLTQVYRDLKRFSRRYTPEEFIANNLDGAPEAVIDDFSSRLKDFLSADFLLNPTQTNAKLAQQWEQFCLTFFRTYQEQQLEKLGDQAIMNT